LIEVSDNGLLIEVGGVGYGVGCIRQLANDWRKRVNKEVLVWTFLKIKEDGMEFYGFANQEEVDLFTKLNNVSGIGPKSALSMMSLGEVSELVGAIDRAEVNYITKANGIGKKTAQRLIMELKGKLVVDDEEKIDDDVLGALQSLGYTRGEYEEIVRLVPEDLQTSEEKISWLLKKLGK